MLPRALTLLVSLLALLLAAGCGGATTPADEVPALAGALDRVDEAVAAEQYAAAREAVAELTDTAEAAQESGRLDADAATRILTAAAALLDALPPQPPSEPEPAAPSSPATTSTDEEDEEAEDEGEDDDETGSDESGKPDTKPTKTKSSKDKTKK